MPDDLVIYAWNQVPDPSGLATALAEQLLGRHPGPLHHACPSCGSIEHGRPYFDAPVEVSVAHAPPVTLVAVSTSPRIGVDLERLGAVERAWVASEAVAKAHGVGVTGSGSVPPRTGELVDLTVPGHIAVLAVGEGPVPDVREWTGAAEAQALPTTR